MEVELSDVENIIRKSEDSVGLLFKINRRIFLTSLYYLTKDKINVCDLSDNAIILHITS